MLRTVTTDSLPPSPTPRRYDGSARKAAAGAMKVAASWK
jgi:hypothetical protein